jgi:hypothetical protein
MQTLIYSLIVIGAFICILWFFTGFRIYTKDNPKLKERDYYLEWFNPFTNTLNQVIITTTL